MTDMRLKHVRKSPSGIRNSSGQDLKHPSVVPAFVISAPDLNLRTTLRNLLSYCLDCVNSLSRSGGDRKAVGEHFSRCVGTIERLYKENSDDLDAEVRRLLVEFVEEAVHVTNLVRSFVDNTEPDDGAPGSYHPLGLLLTAKASRLQWLVVCLLEELKRPAGN